MPASSPVTKQPEGAATADKLTTAEVKDTADTSPRTAPPNVSGKRLRAIPYQNASTVIVKRVDFRTASSGEIDHPDVRFDFRKDNFTVPVGGKEAIITDEAADFLASNYPTDFEYINDGSDDSEDSEEKSDDK